jgi:hypothetical protein
MFPFAVAAVLSHILSNGEERPVAYASKSLSTAEKKYFQLDKEALHNMLKLIHNF